MENKDKSKKPEPPKQVVPQVKLKNEPKVPEAVTKQLDEIMRRLRQMEERYSALRKKSDFTEQTMLRDAKELYDQTKVLQETITDITHQVSELNEKLIKLSDEIQSTVSKADFNVLSKYLDYWQPMNFLTRKEAESLLNNERKL